MGLAASLALVLFATVCCYCCYQLLRCVFCCGEDAPPSSLPTTYTRREYYSPLPQNDFNRTATSTSHLFSVQRTSSVDRPSSQAPPSAACASPLPYKKATPSPQPPPKAPIVPSPEEAAAKWRDHTTIASSRTTPGAGSTTTSAPGLIPPTAQISPPPASHDPKLPPFKVSSAAFPPPPISSSSSSPSSSGSCNDAVGAKDSTRIWTPPGSRRGAIPVYKIPRHLEEQIERDEAPRILHEPLSPSNYADYFACLLYAEDHYLEKWAKYLLKNVNLQLHKEDGEKKMRNMRTKKIEDVASPLKYKQDAKKREKKNKAWNVFENERDYVAFELCKINERRPYLLSRDFVFLQAINEEVFRSRRFEGRIVRVIHSTTALAEFDSDFHSYHKPEKKYDVSFSFNRVCLKRAHHAVANALGPVLCLFLFPVKTSINRHPLQSANFTGSSLNSEQKLAVCQILRIRSPPPYLIRGRPSFDNGDLSRTGAVVREAIIKLYNSSDNNRILLCTPTNRTCDDFVTNLSEVIPNHDMFRANAAFRDVDDVPDDIRASSSYDGRKECFVCPQLSTLKQFRLISSTYISSFRLSHAGIGTDHFTHIFLVDASSITEPEAAVPLASLANEGTALVVTGCSRMSPSHVRSDLARRHGLKLSYFHRLLQRDLYCSEDPSFTCNIES